MNIRKYPPTRIYRNTNGTLMKKITYCWLIAFLWVAHTAQAQYVYDYKHTADVFYGSRDYYSAAQYYSKALGTFKISPEEVKPYAIAGGKVSGKLKDYEEVVYRLAESYRKFYDYGNAESHYAQVVGFNNPQYPLARYWYGVCLRFNGKYGEALQQFKQFQQGYKLTDEISARVPLEIATCEFALAEETKLPRYAIVKTAGNVNDGGANYAPVMLGTNTLLFTSSRPDAPVPPADKRGKDKKNNPYVNNIYTADGSGNNFANSKKVSIPTVKGLDQGTAAITPDGKTMFLTRWQMKEGVKVANIYTSTLSGSTWSEPKNAGSNINVDGYNSMQPSVTADGKYLLFSSNRPGGMGKNDIWYATLNSSAPGAARNIGTAINTKEEEQAPFYDAEKNLLVFSTDGRVGYGGLDFFHSEGDFGTWSQPVNMGKPVNSPKDDVYYTALDNAHPLAAGFISSDRESVCCLEIFNLERIRKVVNGLIVDCDNNTPLEGATVSLLDPARKKVVGKVVLDRTGRYRFEVDPARKYKLVAEKESYFTKAYCFNTDTLNRIDSMRSPVLCLKKYEIEKPIVLNNIYYDYNKATLREESKVVLDTVVSMLLDNPRLRIEMSAHTDSIGTDKYNMKLSQARAQSCVNYLISKGIPKSRLEARGYGKAKPVAPNSTPDHKDNPEGRQLNRRTEFKVLRPRGDEVRTEIPDQEDSKDYQCP